MSCNRPIKALRLNREKIFTAKMISSRCIFFAALQDGNVRILLVTSPSLEFIVGTMMLCRYAVRFVPFKFKSGSRRSG